MPLHATPPAKHAAIWGVELQWSPPSLPPPKNAKKAIVTKVALPDGLTPDRAVCLAGSDPENSLKLHRHPRPWGDSRFL